MAALNSRHLKVLRTSVAIKYRSPRGGKPKIYPRDRNEHARELQQQLAQIHSEFDVTKQARQDAQLSTDFGLILNIDSEPNRPLDFTRLEQAPSRTKDGIVLLNVRIKQTPNGVVTSAAILVPYGRLDILEKKVRSYADATKDGETTLEDGTVVPKPRNSPLLNNIALIGVAALEALWTDPDPFPQVNEPVWWEMWVRRDDPECKANFDAELARLELAPQGPPLKLPDHFIVLFKATRNQIQNSLTMLNTLAEARKARPCSLGLTELRGPDQADWINEALTRIQPPNANAPAVCLIDTGVNRGHALLSPVLAAQDANSVIPQFGNEDHPEPRFAHGTTMAGIATYGDLRELMRSTANWDQTHRLESVKLIHNGHAHDPENYGAVTQQAIYLPETIAPNRLRSYCIAITRSSPANDGRPSSWSAAIDATAAGSGEENAPKRVILISAGNHRDFLQGYTYPDSNHRSMIEDPAQSWNAIAVGASTNRSVIEESDDESRRMRAVGVNGGLSPFSRTSTDWRPNWPIKPDIVMEGGNLAITAQNEFVQRDSLELITTSPSFSQKPLTTINATSAATAAASRLSARVQVSYPDLWPETIRGLVVHSARWTNSMLGALDPYRTGSKENVQQLLRTFGFGQPDTSRVVLSGENAATLICEDSLQPYEQSDLSAAIRLKDCNLHTFPWPKNVLQGDPDVTVTLRVTLSYFIDPNPGSRTWLYNTKYRYPGCLLRFRVKHKDQSTAQFRASLERASVEDESEDESEDMQFINSGWALGPRLCGKAGSLVQDIWRGAAGQLAEMGQIGIFPVKGWWASRRFPVGHEWHNCHERRIRYSLIVSLEAETELPLYSTIANLINLPAAELET